MLALEHFSTENFTVNDQPVDPTTETKWRLAVFFTFHYGMFHLVYFFFLVGQAQGAPLFTRWIWICAAAFALNHLWSYRYNREHDRQGNPNIGTLMMTPYLRIVPMHLTILSGGLFAHARAGVLLFAGPDRADVAMHVVEHADEEGPRRPSRVKPVALPARLQSAAPGPIYRSNSRWSRDEHPLD
jgi:hypothetical protein